MWKVIYVSSHALQLTRLTRALEQAGLLCQTRPVGNGGATEIMVSAAEVEEAHAVLVRVMCEGRQDP